LHVLQIGSFVSKSYAALICSAQSVATRSVPSVAPQLHLRGAEVPPVVEVCHLGEEAFAFGAFDG